MRRKTIVTAVSIGAALFTSAVQAEPVDATNTLPAAKPGQCYAKVMIPAKYETTTEKVLVGEEAEKIEPVAAVYQEVEQQILIKKEDVKLIPIPAVYEMVQEKIEISPRQTIWVNDLGKKGVPVSPMLLSAAKSGGVDVDAAIPGMCFQEYYQAAQFKTEEKDILVSEKSENIRIVPAAYEWVEKKVLVKEAAKKIVDVPATYETVTEQVLVEPAKTVWKKGNGLVERIDNTTGEIMCLVEIPAQYKTISKRVVKTPATTKEVEIPAVYKMVKVRNMVTPASEKRSAVLEGVKTISRQIKVADASFAWHATHERKNPAGKTTGNQICLKEIPAKYHEYKKKILKTAATVRKEPVPPVYETIKLSKVVSNANEKRTKIPAEYKTVAKRKKVSEERLEWRQVLCETNMTKEIVTRVQGALTKAGHNVGTVDGVIGGATLRAVDDYQRKKGLPRGGLTIRTLESLGVQL